MRRLVLSPAAENDLVEIWSYIAADSPANADRFLERLHE
jgi:toxin ParE1/3/4